MLTLITGAPGSGKSACLVQHLVDIAAKKRPIYVDGVPDLAIDHEPFDPKKWHLPVEQGGLPDGACFVVDEAQRVWRPRGAGSKVPDEIAAMETHRHRGLDGFFVTQAPSLIDANIRRLIGRHIHFRDLGVLGRWWYEWPECGSPEQWKSAPIKKRYRLPKAVFSKYKSASLHVKPIRSLPPVLIVFLLCLVGALGIGYKAFANVRERISEVEEAPRAAMGLPPGQQTGHPQTAGASSAGTLASVPASAPVAPPAAASEPDAPALAGCIHMGPRCECITTTGVSVEVDLQACQRDARRSGVGVPYPTGSGSHGGLPAGLASPAVRPPSDAVAVAPSAIGWNAGDFRNRPPPTPAADFAQ